jgi:hypothetical protein
VRCFFKVVAITVASEYVFGLFAVMEMAYNYTSPKCKNLKLYNINSKSYENHTITIHFINITMAEVFMNFMEN